MGSIAVEPTTSSLSSSSPSTCFITGLAHVNLIVPPDGLPAANEFYGKTLGLLTTAVPKSMAGKLAWFTIPPTGQQIHIALGPAEVESSRHPCFQVGSETALRNLQKRIWEHFADEERVLGKPRTADRPGEENSGSKAAEFPTRFFARDFAGNRLEFSL